MIKYSTDTAEVQNTTCDGFFVGWPNPPSEKSFKSLLCNSSEVVLAIDTETKSLIGFITAVTDQTLCAYIPLLEVLPSHQGRGIGKKLTQQMMKILNEYYMVDLMCDHDLVPFYERFGMQKYSGMIMRNYEKQSGRL